MPILIGLVFVAVMSLFPEPRRRHVNAVLVGGAGAAYLSGGGLGYWELLLPVVMTFVAYKGLNSWTWIGVGWLIHTAWDVVHHLKGSPILPFFEHSSFGCAICDPVIALWCFVTAARTRGATPRPRTSTHSGPWWRSVPRPARAAPWWPPRRPGR